jgi:hypothetical protein
MAAHPVIPPNMPGRWRRQDEDRLDAAGGMLPQSRLAARPGSAGEEAASVIPARAPQRAPSAAAAGFVRFCYRRRRVGWPELYDEMCAVAGRRLYEGWGPEELDGEGIGFGLAEMPSLAVFVRSILEEEAGRRPDRPTPGESSPDRRREPDGTSSFPATPVLA